MRGAGGAISDRAARKPGLCGERNKKEMNKNREHEENTRARVQSGVKSEGKFQKIYIRSGVVKDAGLGNCQCCNSDDLVPAPWDDDDLVFTSGVSRLETLRFENARRGTREEETKGFWEKERTRKKEKKEKETNRTD